MKSGFLVSFEGGEGCGKSTQVKLLKEELKNRGEDFLYVREPGGTEYGEKIREILLHGKEELSSTSEFLLFSASRSILIDEVVQPALNAGKIVIMDRFYDSSLVYQGYAGTLALDKIQKINQMSTKGLVPDLTILLDIDPKVAFSRKESDEKLKDLDRIESKPIEYHQKVRSGYLDLAKKDKKRFLVVDATCSIEEIQNQIITEFDSRLAKKNEFEK